MARTCGSAHHDRPDRSAGAERRCGVSRLPEPYYHDEEAGIVIYCADNRDILPLLEPGSVDLVLTDPPYGIAWDGRVMRGPNGTGQLGPTRHYGITIRGDTQKFDPSPWLSFPRVVLWGFHHFNDMVPTGSVLVWLKRSDGGFGSFLSDADTAWMKGGHGVYCFRDLSLQGEWSREGRLHPAQKPASLMRWCIRKSRSTSGIILDPFMGSGTTLRAAKDLGRRAIGIEIEEKYCETAVKRLRQAVLPLGGAA